MGKFIDLTGQRFGRLTIVKRVENSNTGLTRWLCQCDCNKQTVVASGHLKSGHTKSCGCLRKELPKLEFHNLKHGHNRRNKTSQTYKTWKTMIQRCTNLKNPDYKNYGGRGIRVCEAWLSFEGFFQDMGERPPNMSLDRIDNSGDYRKENCKWSTAKEQARNMRTNRLFTINDITKCLVEWCEIYDKPYHKVWERINKYHWTPEEALELVPRKKRKKNV